MLLSRSSVNRAKVNATGGPYHTALQAAVVTHLRGRDMINKEQNKTIKHLLTRGADAGMIGGRFYNALHAAVLSDRHNSVIRILFKYELSEPGLNVNMRDAEGRTALLLAAARGNYRTYRLLLKLGADESLVDTQARGLIHMAVMGSETGYHT
ncbi:ankyrin repeat-containing domain protein [Bombardia bombarda]|uniref:protein S-acyltransferase n=1 Tax=Bombardia bombarda TaxID=252184 RepID=A0AA39XCE8_9PEZI|nr:ankyrin repeat-containing domain protein [Bombardia bombarda]